MRFNIRETLTKYRRILIITRKPDYDELKETARICAIGFIVMGIVGFLFYVVSVILGGI
jgi:protein translocase SEC61 complex gamma subunit